MDNIEGEWSAFNEILRRKNSSIQTQVATLQVKIVAEDKAIEARSAEYVGEWDRGKPVEGATPPRDALQVRETTTGQYHGSTMSIKHIHLHLIQNCRIFFATENCSLREQVRETQGGQRQRRQSEGCA